MNSSRVCYVPRKFDIEFAPTAPPSFGAGFSPAPKVLRCGEGSAPSFPPLRDERSKGVRKYTAETFLAAKLLRCGNARVPKKRERQINTRRAGKLTNGKSDAWKIAMMKFTFVQGPKLLFLTGTREKRGRQINTRHVGKLTNGKSDAWWENCGN